MEDKIRGRWQRVPEQVQLKDMRVDLRTQKVLKAGSEVALTTQEFALLEALISRRGIPVTRKELLRVAWGWRCDDANTRTVDVHIQHLRKKLGLGREIQTVYKVGYRLS